MKTKKLLFGVLSGLLMLCNPAASYAESVDLSTWTAESYGSVTGFPSGNWQVQSGNTSVKQVNNGQPTFFYGDFNAIGTAVVGKILVTGGDDDQIGFALGFKPGDTTNPSADYLLVDWKGGTQGHDFGSPSCHSGGTAYAGLAVSRVTGVPTADEFWQRTDYPEACGTQQGGLEELQRGASRGSTGWNLNTTYEFNFEFTPTSLKVWVDGDLEIDIVGNFGDGQLAFYNFSQAGVTYSGFEVELVDTDNDGVPDNTDECPLDATNDADDDDVCGGVDNCPTVSNADQADTDKDGVGNACNEGEDNDGDDWSNELDNCPAAANPTQFDTDLDGTGNACDSCPIDPLNDADSDGVCGDIDNCPVTANSDQANNDGDGEGNACDDDDDNDNFADGVDNCPLTPNDQSDYDNDGQGDACDDDVDGDLVNDSVDACLSTAVGALVNGAGCEVAQLCPCDNNWKNHGAYVKCVAHAANDFRDAGLISDSEHGEVVSEAGQSSCGAKK